jgi:predicted Zn-dependent protease
MTKSSHPLRTGAEGHHRWLLLLLLATASTVMGCAESPTASLVDDSNPPGANPSLYDHTRSAGASAADFLSADDFDRLVVQIQYVEGFEPSAGGLQRLEDFLSARLNKPAGIEISVDSTPLRIEAQAIYSAADIREIEAQNRTTYTQGRTLAAYFLFLDGEYADQSNVLGIAYNNTSMAIFAEKIGEYTGGPLEPSQATVEGTVAMHELGHVLGLVNTGSPMQVEHQDEPHGHHCDDENCLMYYAVRTTDFISNLLGGVPDLDQSCIDDLRANGGA